MDGDRILCKKTSFLFLLINVLYWPYLGWAIDSKWNQLFALQTSDISL